MNARQTPFRTVATDEIRAAIHATLAERLSQGFGPDAPHRFSAERLVLVHCIAVTSLAEISACWQLVATGLSISEVGAGLIALRELAKVRVAEAVDMHERAITDPRGAVVDCSVPVILPADADPLRQQRQALNGEILKAAVQQVLNWNLLVQQGDVGGWPSSPDDVFAWAVGDARLALQWETYGLTDDVGEPCRDMAEYMEDTLHDMPAADIPPSVAVTLLESIRRAAFDALLSSVAIRSTR